MKFLKIQTSLLGFLLCLVSDIVLAQAPNISYPSPSIFVLGQEIAPLVPTNIGGEIPQNGDYSVFAAGLSYPIGLAFNSKGILFVSNSEPNLLGSIVQIDKKGNVNSFAGSVNEGYLDGQSMLAKFNNPKSIVFDQSDNLYVADSRNFCYRKISPNGLVSTFTGIGTKEGDIEGDAKTANFNDVSGITIDPSQNLYVTQYCRIRKITNNGTVSAFVGDRGIGDADGQGSLAGFYKPHYLVTDQAGNIFVADRANNKIRKVSSSGRVSTFKDLTGSLTKNDMPNSIAIDKTEDFYIGGESANLYKLSKTGEFTKILDFPFPILGLAIDTDNKVYFSSGNVVYKLTSPNYKIFPTQLPLGLSFDEKTGMISGTPTSLTAATTYTVTVDNESGTSTTTLSITVKPLTPKVVVKPATQIIATAASLNGTVNASGATNVKCTFLLSTLSGEASYAVASVSGNIDTPVIFPITSLIPDTTYRFRLQIDNGYETVYSNYQDFTTPKARLTISGLTANDKSYDGTTSIIFSGFPVLNGLVTTGETNNASVKGASRVVLNYGSTSFVDAEVGPNKSILNSIYLSGLDASKYILEQSTFTANIIPAMIVIMPKKQTKVYGDIFTFRETDYIVVNIFGMIIKDLVDQIDLTSQGTIASSDVGTYNISASNPRGANLKATNYFFIFINVDFIVTPKPVQIIGFSANDKIYDGNKQASILTSGTLDGIIGTDDVSIHFDAVNFSDKNVGDNKMLTATNLQLLGEKAFDYILSPQPTFPNASILPKGITISVNQNLSKIYGSKDPDLTYTFNPDLALGDKLSGGLARAQGENVGKYVVNQASLTASANYSIDFISANFSIEPKAISVDLSNVNTNKVYDGTTNASINGKPVLVGLLAEDLGKVNLTNPTSNNFMDKNVGLNKTVLFSDFTITGLQALNYKLIQPVDFKAKISQSNLSIGITAFDKNYDGETDAETSALVVNGLFAGDLVNPISRNGQFQDENAGIAKLVTADISTTGKDAVNYTFNSNANSNASINPIDLIATLSYSPNLLYVKGGVPLLFTATFESNVTLVDIVPVLQVAVAGTRSKTDMKVKDALNWTNLWTAPLVGDGRVGVNVIAPEIANNYKIHPYTSKTYLVLDNTPPTIQLSDDRAFKTVKDGDLVNFTATFADLNGIDENTPPLITIDGAIANAIMSKVSNLVWTYKWQVKGDLNKNAKVSVAAFDVARNFVEGGENLGFFKIDNTAPIVSFPGMTGNARHTFTPILIQLNDTVKLIKPLNQNIILREGGETGMEIGFQTTNTSFNSLAPQISLIANLKCATQYYLAVRAGVFTDLVGNPVVLTSTTFTTDPLPTKPLISGTSSANQLAKYCLNDSVLCTNFENSPFIYQWKLESNNIVGQNGASLRMTPTTNGLINLQIKNTITGCENISDPFLVAVNPIVTPRIEIKLEPKIASHLLVDNSANTYVSYYWTKADGLAIGGNIPTNRQFISLPGQLSTGAYKVLITDKNGCKIESGIKHVKSSFAFSELYPTINSGAFKLYIFSQEAGVVAVKAYNHLGVMLQQVSFEKADGPQTFEVNMLGLKTGAYTLKVVLGNFGGAHTFFVE